MILVEFGRIIWVKITKNPAVWYCKMSALPALKGGHFNGVVLYDKSIWVCQTKGTTITK